MVSLGSLANQGETAVQRMLDQSTAQDRFFGETGVTSAQLMYSIMSQEMAGYDELTPLHRQLLQRWGYNPDVKVIQGEQSFFALLIKPYMDTGLPPLLVFRGSNLSKTDDIKADLVGSIGKDKFLANRALIGKALTEAGAPVVAIGYSLGGALAQRTAAAFVDRVSSVVTFESPGIDSATANDVVAPSTHFIDDQDIVPKAGAAHSTGLIIVQKLTQKVNYKNAHGLRLYEEPRFRKMLAELGVDDAALLELRRVSWNGRETSTTRDVPQDPTDSETRTEPSHRTVEVLREEVGGAAMAIMALTKVLHDEYTEPPKDDGDKD